MSCQQRSRWGPHASNVKVHGRAACHWSPSCQSSRPRRRWPSEGRRGPALAGHAALRRLQGRHPHLQQPQRDLRPLLRLQASRRSTLPARMVDLQVSGVVLKNMTLSSRSLPKMLKWLALLPLPDLPGQLRSRCLRGLQSWQSHLGLQDRNPSWPPGSAESSHYQVKQLGLMRALFWCRTLAAQRHSWKDVCLCVHLS